MSDVHKLIELILSDEKLKNSKSMKSKIYSDEPIIKAASHLASYIPAEISMLMKEAFRKTAFYQPVESEFIRQARMMEHYEDNYDYKGEFSCYYPTYRDMNSGQMRGYFSWRTKVRRGIVERTSLSFVFVYIYELLHLIGVSSAERSFETLFSFWKIYREIDPHINSYMKTWLSDFVVYYNLDSSYMEKVCSTDFDKQLIKLRDYSSSTDDELYDAICSMSSYRLEKSAFFRQYPDDTKNAVCSIYRSLADYYGKNRKKSFCEHLFGQRLENSYRMFEGAVFYDCRKYEDYEYNVSDIQKYRCENGRWRCEKYYGEKGRNHRLGDVMKTIDSIMRVRYGFSRPVNQVLDSKYLIDIISKELDGIKAQKDKKQAAEIRIDVSKLEGIRAAADITRDKLIVEEIPDNELCFSEITETPDENITAVAKENTTPLDSCEYEIMQCLLYGGDCIAAAKKNGRMLSVAADSINEKLFDIFGDTVIEFDGDMPVLIEDYTDELKGMITEQ